MMLRFWDHFAGRDEFETVDKVLNHKNSYGKKAYEFCMKNVDEVIRENCLNRNKDWDLIVKLTAKKINNKWLHTMEDMYG
jgi:hypothetical protein